eukprot:RCo019680
MNAEDKSPALPHHISMLVASYFEEAAVCELERLTKCSLRSERTIPKDSPLFLETASLNASTFASWTNGAEPTASAGASRITAERCFSGTSEVDTESELELCQKFHDLNDTEAAAKTFVEDLRASRFGEGQQFGEAAHRTLKKALDMLTNALQMLSTELYTTDSHFVLELLQNAD